MKLWILITIGWGIYLAFFKKDPEVLEDLPETSKDTMLATYSPRGGSGARHETRRELTEGAKRLMGSNLHDTHKEEFKEIFGKDFLDNNTEEIPFTDV
jgi:hypothetical protein